MCGVAGVVGVGVGGVCVCVCGVVGGGRVALGADARVRF